MTNLFSLASRFGLEVFLIGLEIGTIILPRFRMNRSLSDSDDKLNGTRGLNARTYSKTWMERR